MHISRHGDPAAPVLLLVHGGMLTGSMWEQQVEVFADEYHILVPDLPGHGASADQEPTTYADVADELAGALAGRTEVTAVGLGIGGQICLELIARRSGLVRNAVVVSALTCELPEPAWRKALPTPAIPLQLPLGLPSQRRRRSVDAFQAERKAFRLPEGLRGSAARALVAGGDREQREVVASVAETAAAFADSQAVVVPGTGLDWIVHRPEQFNQTVAAWVAGDSVSLQTAL